MSLNFAGANNNVVFGVGNLANLGNGAFTLVALWKLASPNSNTGLIAGLSGGFERQGYGLSGGNEFGTGDFSSGFGPLAVGDFWWVGMTKPAGPNHYRCHTRDYSTAGAWSHGEAVGAANHGDPAASTSLQVGAGPSFGGGAGDVAVVAGWTSVLTDLAIEAACTSALADLMTANPNWAVEFKQSTAASSRPDLTGGGGNETGRNGALTATADPPGYNFALTSSGGLFLPFFG